MVQAELCSQKDATPPESRAAPSAKTRLYSVERFRYQSKVPRVERCSVQLKHLCSDHLLTVGLTKMSYTRSGTGGRVRIRTKSVPVLVFSTDIYDKHVDDDDKIQGRVEILSLVWATVGAMQRSREGGGGYTTPGSCCTMPYPPL